MAFNVNLLQEKPKFKFFTTEEAKHKEPITEDMDYSRHNLSIFSFLSLFHPIHQIQIRVEELYN